MGMAAACACHARCFIPRHVFSFPIFLQHLILMVAQHPGVPYSSHDAGNVIRTLYTVTRTLYTVTPHPLHCHPALDAGSIKNLWIPDRAALVRNDTQGDPG